MIQYKRSIYKQIKKWLFQKKVIVLYGARQVGKTTLSKQLVDEYDGLYLNCERMAVRQLLIKKNIELLRAELGTKNLVVFDEAQKVKGIGEILKYFVDEYPDVQYIATGSSSFDLANETAEPLTGRKVSFELYPLSVQEQNISALALGEHIPNLLIYGSYPAIVNETSAERKRVLLSELATDYLYKDVLEFQKLKKPELLLKLLKLLALQLGNQVSTHELANTLKTSSETIERYLDLLEKVFVIKKVAAFSNNPRKEISKSHKIYFYDVGIRNALIENFAALDARIDTGHLWENFCFIERLKKNQRDAKNKQLLFWRTYSGQEVDIIEVYDGKITGFEVKYNPRKKVKIPNQLKRLYPEIEFEVVNPETVYKFLL